MEQDWDTLLLLDACRYDDFQKINDLDGELHRKFSKGADSPGFINKNFNGETLHDTVYVTANPNVIHIDEGIFHAVIDEPLSEWNEEYRCVMPHSVTEAAIKAHRTYPNKRIIVHYMQPHDPPIGPTGDEIRERYELAGPIQDSPQGVRIMDAVAEGDVPVKEARQAYRETLKIVVDEVEELYSVIDGKLVISADHGELFGESYPILGRLYEHFNHPRTRALCEIPWFEMEYNDQRKIIAEPPSVKTVTENEKLESQLEALGYVN